MLAVTRRMRLGHPDQAEAAYDEAIRLGPEDGWSFLGRGLARKNRGSIEPAIADLSRSVALEPNVPTAWGLRGEIYGVQGRWTEAASDFAQWFAQGGDPPVIPWYYHALLRVYANDLPGYRQACMRMWERFSSTSDPFAASLLSHACTLAPDCGVSTDRVVELARKVARDHHRDGWTLFALGSALRRANQPDRALNKLEEAMRVDPNWTGRPLIVALRDLTERSLLGSPEFQSQSGGHRDQDPALHTSSSQLQSQIKKLNAAWQYQIEAILLGRELDARSAPDIEGVIQGTAPHQTKGEQKFNNPR